MSALAGAGSTDYLGEVVDRVVGDGWASEHHPGEPTSDPPNS
jgi:hypothetical protein